MILIKTILIKGDDCMFIEEKKNCMFWKTNIIKRDFQ